MMPMTLYPFIEIYIYIGKGWQIKLSTLLCRLLLTKHLPLAGLFPSKSGLENPNWPNAGNIPVAKHLPLAGLFPV